MLKLSRKLENIIIFACCQGVFHYKKLVIIKFESMDGEIDPRLSNDIKMVNNYEETRREKNISFQNLSTNYCIYYQCICDFFFMKEEVRDRRREKKKDGGRKITRKLVEKKKTLASRISLRSILPTQM